MLAILAFSILTGFGTNNFSVEEGATTLEFAQSEQSLTLEGTDSLGETLGGYFTPARNWQYVVDLGLRASLGSANPYSVFYVELYSGENLDLEGIYLSDTAPLGDAGATNNLPLIKISSGPGTLSDIRGMQFSWVGGSGSPVTLAMHAIVNLNPPNPKITSFGFAPGGGFLIRWTGTGSIPVNVQRIENLATGTWINIATGITTGEYTDTTPPNNRAFYRIVVP